MLRHPEENNLKTGARSTVPGTEAKERGLRG